MASSDPSKRPPPGPWTAAPDSAAMPPSSWAKRTGFRPKFSGETNASDSGQITALPPPPAPSQAKPKPPNSNLDLEAGRPRPPAPTSNGEAVVARDRAKEKEEKEKERKEKEKELTPPVRKRRDSDGGTKLGANGQAAGEGSRRAVRNEEAAAAADVLPQTVLDDDGFISRQSHMKYELRDSPGLGELLIPLC